MIIPDIVETFSIGTFKTVSVESAINNIIQIEIYVGEEKCAVQVYLWNGEQHFWEYLGEVGFTD